MTLFVSLAIELTGKVVRSTFPVCFMASLVLAAASAAPEPADAHYVLRPGDSVQVAVFGEPDLLAEQRIDPNGEVRLPLLGNFRLAGLSVRRAEEALEASFVEREFLRSPQVSVRVQQYMERSFVVLGQVRSPGRKQFPPERASVSIVDVISDAGGFTGVARGDSVRVTRVDPESGEEETFSVNVERIISGRGQNGSRDGPGFDIVPGDIIFVPERLF